MSGAKFLLDTNIIIGLVKGNDEIMQVLDSKNINIDDCAYSSITRIELLGYPQITETEHNKIMNVLKYDELFSNQQRD